ncbi:hypothetical protein JOD54_004469 [Actinokineospora baliensis]|uniref:hypothetical protein n=1 Tax=Actinokineospora baliensis TaxID=547056 RepID=UPI00195AAE6B|nr:hypothetical protein [Actinokineospora baliensis]MBM7774265.1 hypothetical protein [Actinokineospora baliensis]
MKKWTVVVLALVFATGLVTAPAATADQAGSRLSGGYWVLRTPDGAGLVERDGLIGLGAPGRATRWRITYAGPSDSGPTYLIMASNNQRGWVLPGAAPSTPVRVSPMLLLPTDPRTLRWTIHSTNRGGRLEITISSALNGWPVVPNGAYDPRLVVVPETFAPVTYLATRVG